MAKSVIEFNVTMGKMKQKDWFKLTRMTKTGEDSGVVEIELLDEIGYWGTSAKQFMRQMKDMIQPGDKVRLTINSPGGDVIDGFAIYNTIAALDNHVTAEITGYAASMASIIAMAADTIEIHSNSYLMIHNPWTLAVGESDDLRKMADLMDNMKQHAISAYQKHTRLTSEEISNLMDDETWMDGIEAVEKGFAEKTLGAVQVAACAKGKLENIPNKVKEMFAMKNEDNTEAETQEITPEEIPTNEVENNETQPEEPQDESTDTPEDGSEETEPAPEESESGDETPEGSTNENTNLSERADAVLMLQAELDKEREAVSALKTDLAHKEKQLSAMQSERDQALAANEKLETRLTKLALPGMRIPEDSGPSNWDDAVAKLTEEHGEAAYDVAREKHPDLYEQMMKKEG